MNTQVGSQSGHADLAYLLPLFDRAATFRLPSGDIAPMAAPSAGSSLAADDAPLQGWNASTLVRSSVTAGLAHVEALNRMITKTGVVDAFSPWTLLRGALENFATAVWLLTGADRNQRRSKALALWAQDLHNRAQHEDDTDHVITGAEEKSGMDRREEILQRGERLGIPRTSLPRTSAGAIIFAAAEAAGLDARAVRAYWRAGSGFAHGRYWPNLRVSQARAAWPTDGGYLLAFVLDEGQHALLAESCDRLLQFAHERYRARSLAP